VGDGEGADIRTGKTEEKSNEITTIPTLLEKLALEGCIVTIDAIGCQYKIADLVVKKKADYLFSLKKNQETLYEDVQEYFRDLDFSLPADKNRDIPFQSVSTHDERGTDRRPGLRGQRGCGVAGGTAS
jgi:hypothetical protein